MEHRLLKYIMKPALVATYAFGFILIYENDYLLSEDYFLLKLVLVFILSLFHIYLSLLFPYLPKRIPSNPMLFSSLSMIWVGLILVPMEVLFMRLHMSIGWQKMVRFLQMRIPPVQCALQLAPVFSRGNTLAEST